jgi:hypothetical protein
MQNDMLERVEELVSNATQWFCVDMLKFELRIELSEDANAWRITHLVDHFLQSKTMDLTEMMSLTSTPSLLEMMNLMNLAFTLTQKNFNLMTCGV